jgi:hypothetical protein
MKMCRIWAVGGERPASFWRACRSVARCVASDRAFEVLDPLWASQRWRISPMHCRPHQHATYHRRHWRTSRCSSASLRLMTRREQMSQPNKSGPPAGAGTPLCTISSYPKLSFMLPGNFQNGSHQNEITFLELTKQTGLAMSTIKAARAELLRRGAVDQGTRGLGLRCQSSAQPSV